MRKRVACPNDRQSERRMPETIFDAIVIGSGASGGFAAKELTAQGLRVLQLEAGPEIGPQHFNPNYRPRQTEINLWQRAKAVFAGQGIQARAAFFDGRTRHLYVNDRKSPYSTPKDAPFLWIRGRQAGGRTHVFGRVLMRWTDDDFKIHSRTGKGVDWPISYAELAPFYEQVERTLGLYGRNEHIPTLPDSVYTHEAKLTPAETEVKATIEARWPDRRATTWRYIGHEPTRVFTPLREALASGLLDIRYNSIVRKILTDKAGGKATGVEIVDAVSGEVKTLEAKIIFVCASPVESIRLLLNSASEAHPQGLANSSGMVGRYFVDQVACLVSGTYTKAKGWSTADTAPSDPFYGPSGGLYIPRFVDSDGTASNDFAYQGSVGRSRTGDDRSARFSFMGYGTMQPDPENRVTLHPTRRDAWGVPIPHIRCKMSSEDTDTLRREVDALTEMVQAAGCEIEFIGSALGLVEMGRGAYPDADPFSRFIFRKLFKSSVAMGAAIHEAGGARMGTAPDNSVLNNYNQSWDVPNLYVTDASAFAGGGVSGTTLTIMALTVRACQHAAAQLKAA